MAAENCISIDVFASGPTEEDAAMFAAFMAPVVAEYEKFDDAQKLIEGLNKVSESTTPDTCFASHKPLRICLFQTFNAVYAEAAAVAAEFSPLLGRTVDASAVRKLLFDPEPAHAL